MPSTTETSPANARWSAEQRPAHGGRARRRSTGTRHEDTPRRSGPAEAPASAAGFPGQIGVPALPRRFAPRPRLTGILAGERRATIVLLTAPTGYGKTALLADWARQEERPVAWVTLGAEHNDPSRLLASVIAALERCHAPGVPTAGGDRGAPAGAALERLMGAAERGLAASGGGQAPGVVVVLDDLQAVRERESLALVDFLAAVMPASSTLALASRVKPALPLGRLRLRHGVLRLEASALAATDGEAGAMLAAAGLLGDRAEVGRVLARAAGWPGAIALLADSRLERGDGLEQADREAAQERALLDYVNDEVLAELGSRERAFLAQASVLEELSAELCNTVMEREDAGTMLRALAAERLLLAPIAARDEHGGARYHMNPLLREALRGELIALDPALCKRLHRRASRRHEERGEIDLAVAHAAAGGEAGRVGRLLQANCDRYVLRGRAREVHGWLARLGEPALEGSPELALAASHAWLEGGDLDRTEHWARVASGALAGPRAGRRRAGARAALEAGVAMSRALACRQGMRTAAEQAARAYELEGEAGHWRAAACLVRGVAEHLAGSPGEARALLAEGASRGAVAAPLAGSLCHAQLALMSAADGDWERAREHDGRAREGIDRAGLDGAPLSALVLGTSAWLLARAGEGDDARPRLRASARALGELAEPVPWYEVQTRVALARASIQLADVTGARALLAQASRAARRMEDAPILHVWLDDAWAAIDEAGAAALSGPSSLTMAELRILRFLPTHLSFREIGGRLHVSTNTVKSQAHAVYSKLGAASRSEAVAQASELGLLDVLVT